VLKESFKIYCAVNDGIINLVDVVYSYDLPLAIALLCCQITTDLSGFVFLMIVISDVLQFFDMTKLDAIKALDIYRRTGNLAKSLSDFYELCRGLELARNFQFPILREPPASFLGTMEEYIREAPRTAPVPNETIEYRQLDFVPYQEAEEQTPEPTFEALDEPAVAEEVPPEPEEEPQFAGDYDEDKPETPTTADLLGLHEVNSPAAALEESNALALAIVPPGGSNNTAAISLGEITAGSSGWELALVTAQPSTSSQLTESKLAGGFDKLLLDSLYEDAARKQQLATMDASQQKDPFAMSVGVAPPTGVQMSVMAQRQQAMFFGTPQQLQPPYGSAASQFNFNPFVDAYSASALASSQGVPLHGSGSFI